MKHVLIIAPEYPSFNNVGGEATFCQNLAQLLSRLAPKHFKVHVLSIDPLAKKHYSRQEEGILVHCFAKKTKHKLFNFFYYRVMFLLRTFLKKLAPFFLQSLDFNVFALFYFKELNQQYHFALIHSVQLSLASYLLKIFNPCLPLLLHLASPQTKLNEFEQRSFLDRQVDRFFEKKYLLLADYLLPCSTNVAQLIKDILGPQHSQSQKMQILPYFIQAKRYQNLATLDKKTLFFMGRLDHRKGIDLILQAFLHLTKKQPQLRLVLIGNEGSVINERYQWEAFSSFFYRKNIQQMIKNKITWLSRLDNRQSLIDLMQYYKGIAVFPARYEPLGLTTLEAMASGMIVIAGKNGGGSEIIKDGQNGFLCSANQASLIKKIEEVIILSTKKQQQISLSAQKRVLTTYDERTMIKKYRKLYRDLKIFD